MSYQKISWMLLVGVLFISACSGRDDKSRLERKEVLYSFTLNESGCTLLTGKGVIENTSQKKVYEALQDSISDLGYITISDNSISVDLPWPYTDITEKVSITAKNQSILLIGEDKMKKLLISTDSFQTGTLVSISGEICIDMPTFLRENVLSSFIKEIIRNLRDKLE